MRCNNMNKEIEKKNKYYSYDGMFSDLGMLLVISIGLALIIILVEQLFGIDFLKFLEDSLKI